MVLLRTPTAVQPMTGIEGFKYQASDGKGSVIHTLFVRDFVAMGISLFNPHAQFLYIRLSEPGGCIGSHP